MRIPATHDAADGRHAKADQYSGSVEFLGPFKIFMLLAWVVGWVLLFRAPRLAHRSAPRAQGSDDPVVPVTIVIPARNEAGSLPTLLDSLASSRPRGARVVVVNDGSEDDTAAVAGGYPFVEIVDADPLRDGWIGKTWACHAGAALAEPGTLVFIDADVTLHGDALVRAIARQREQGGLLTIWPRHVVRNPYESFSALFNVITMMGVGAGSLIRPRRVRGGFGPFMVTSTEAYEAVGGHEAVKGSVIDDFALAGNYAAAGLPIVNLAGGRDVSFRMYPDGFASLLEGWTKNMSAGAFTLSALRFGFIVLWLAVGLGLLRWGGGVPRTFPMVVYGLYVIQLLVMFRQLGNFGLLTALLYPPTSCSWRSSSCGPSIAVASAAASCGVDVRSRRPPVRTYRSRRPQPRFSGARERRKQESARHRAMKPKTTSSVRRMPANAAFSTLGSNDARSGGGRAAIASRSVSGVISSNASCSCQAASRRSDSENGTSEAAATSSTRPANTNEMSRLPTTAVPREVPSSLTVLLTPEAPPACSGSTAERVRLVSWAIIAPVPMPKRSRPGSRSRVVTPGTICPRSIQTPAASRPMPTWTMMARWHALPQPGGGHRDRQRGQREGQECDARRQRAVAEGGLQEQRQDEEHAGIQQGLHGIGGEARNELPVGEQLEAHEGHAAETRAAPLDQDEAHEQHGAQYEQEGNRREPERPQHRPAHLERARRVPPAVLTGQDRAPHQGNQRQAGEQRAPQVQPPSIALLGVLEQRRERQDQQHDAHLHAEAPTPAELARQPATEDRTHRCGTPRSGVQYRRFISVSTRRVIRRALGFSAPLHRSCWAVTIFVRGGGVSWMRIQSRWERRYSIGSGGSRSATISAARSRSRAGGFGAASPCPAVSGPSSARSAAAGSRRARGSGPIRRRAKSACIAPRRRRSTRARAAEDTNPQQSRETGGAISRACRRGRRRERSHPTR